MSCSLKRLLWKLKSSLRLRWQTDFRHMRNVRPKVVVCKSFDLLLDVASAYDEVRRVRTAMAYLHASARIIDIDGSNHPAGR